MQFGTQAVGFRPIKKDMAMHHYMYWIVLKPR